MSYDHESEKVRRMWYNKHKHKVKKRKDKPRTIFFGNREIVCHKCGYRQIINFGLFYNMRNFRKYMRTPYAIRWLRRLRKYREASACVRCKTYTTISTIN